MATVFTNGPTAGTMKVPGRKIKCMDQVEKSPGQMDGVMKENIQTIKKRDMGPLSGLTNVDMRVFGKMENSMGQENITQLKEE